MKFLERFYRLLSSLGLGVVLLALIALILAIATKFEANTSTYLVQAHVYRSGWFDLLLALFGINLALATWNLRPYKFRHWGVLVVHTSLIIILLGAWTTRKFGFEGSMTIVEGQSENAITLRELVLRVVDPADPANAVGVYDTWLNNSPTREHMKQGFVLPDGTELLADRFYTDAMPVIKVTDGGRTQNPAVEFELAAPGFQEKQWLFFNEGSAHRRSFGGFMTVEALDFENETAWKAALQPSTPGFLSFAVGKKQIEIDLNLADTTSIGQGLWVVNKRVYRNFFVGESGASQDRSGRAENPALEFVITDGEKEDFYLFFSRMPSFKALRGQEAQLSEIKNIEWTPSMTDADMSEALVRIGRIADSFHIAWLVEGKIVEQSLDLAKSIDLPWRGLSLTLKRFFERAWRAEDMENMSSEGQSPALRLRAADGDLVDVVWLRAYGSPRKIRANGREWLVQFTPKRVPVGFALHLDDFVEDRYPGTMMASGYASYVTLIDDDDPLSGSEIEISMNNTLQHKGFKFFQSSFQRSQREGGAETTILSVNHDPGHLIVYVGSLGLVLGMFIVFFLKKKLIAMDRRRSTAAKVA